MKKKYQKKKGEPLHKWIDRLTTDVLWHRLEPSDIHDILHEVSIKSYIEGVRTQQEIDAKYPRR